MNYIKNLESQNTELRAEINGLREGLCELKRYLNLPKFFCGNELDGYVNIKDVLLRLQEAEATNNP